MAFRLKYQIRGMCGITEKVLDAFYYVSRMYCYNFAVYLNIPCLETRSSWKLAINDVIEFSGIFIRGAKVINELYVWSMINYIPHRIRDLRRLLQAMHSGPWMECHKFWSILRSPSPFWK